MKIVLVLSIIFQNFVSIANASLGNISLSSDINRVAHGSQPTIGQFKAVVALIFKLDVGAPGDSKSVCTGQIITKQWVMSAVHCFARHLFYKSFYPNRVVSYKITITAGVIDYKENISSRQDRTAGPDDYHIYPGSLETTGKRPPIRNIDKFVRAILDKLDIALLFVNKPFEFNNNVGLIALARNYIVDGIVKPTPCYSVGFGRTDEGKSTDMQYAEVIAGGKNFCKRLKDDYLGIGRGYHICSKGKGRTNICPGDSGGPLICGVGDQSVSVGVLSYYSLKSGPLLIFESMSCGESKKGVATYMFPGHAEKWINEVIGTPNFVAFLKRTDYAGARLCVGCPAVLYLMGLTLIFVNFAYV